MQLNAPRIFVKQVFELAEIFGFETRNKYRVTDEQGRDIGYAAEQGRGILGMVMRQFFGHWRSFDLHVYDVDRRPLYVAEHPFRFFFQKLRVRTADGRPLGEIERRWAYLGKKCVVDGPSGERLFEVSSPLWKPWTFPFYRQGREVARVRKKWTGLGFEMFTDKDTFLVEYLDQSLKEDLRVLVLAAALYIDLMYFEVKAD